MKPINFEAGYYSNQQTLTNQDLVNAALEAACFTLMVDKNGYIRFISELYAEYLGEPREYLLGKKVEEVIPTTKIYDVLASGEPVSGNTFELKDGRTLVCNWTPIKDSYGEVKGVVVMSPLNVPDAMEDLYKTIHQLKVTNELLANQAKGRTYADSIMDTIIGDSAPMMEIKSILKKISNTAMPILLTGESGCGKEVVANAIHNSSIRKDAPFIKVNCAAIPKELIESELFGYEGGTFSGALRGGKAGKFELANNGDILLDEVEELPIDMQAKLLRVLQEYEIERVGSVKPIPLNARIICCSNRNLDTLVAQGKFREDFLFRINTMEIEIPPLRERMDDLPLLSEVIIERINSKYQLSIDSLSQEALDYLMSYSWPGNVRELQHSIERACALTDNRILTKEDFAFLKKKIGSETARPMEPEHASIQSNLVKEKSEAERHAFLAALEQTGGNKTKAAKLLGISRSTFYEKLKTLDLE
ncbi:MAG: sigma 54-interacting transcriptional regulator [Firmicutes bacterium]|jgi:transcriptional regulator with PAS, ATPase and Fis domain|nr:sigma 54-interacting transcriptional regulator [Bacillota bacterium]NBI62222.1 PAS domain-containing protein [Clostridiales bacterium]